MTKAEKIAKEAENSLRNLDNDVEGMAKGAEKFQDAGDVAFVKYVMEFYHERQELLNTMARIRREANTLTKKEDKALKAFQKIFERPNFSLVDVAEQMLYFFWKFMEVFNIHVAYVQDYAGFQTLKDFIQKRNNMFETIKRAVRAPSYSRFMTEKEAHDIDAAATELQNRYSQLWNMLVPLNDLFGEFKKYLNVIYDNTAKLDAFKPFTYVHKPGWWARMKGEKPYVEFRREEALEYYKKNNPRLSPKDRSNLVKIRGLADKMHRTVVVAIRQRKETVRQEILQISDKEGDFSNLLQDVAKTVDAAIKRQREQLMPKKKAA